MSNSKRRLVQLAEAVREIERLTAHPERLPQAIEVAGVEGVVERLRHVNEKARAALDSATGGERVVDIGPVCRGDMGDWGRTVTYEVDSPLGSVEIVRWES